MVQDNWFSFWWQTISLFKMLINGFKSQRVLLNKKMTTIWCLSMIWIQKWQFLCYHSSLLTNSSRNFIIQHFHSFRIICSINTLIKACNCKVSCKKTLFYQSYVCSVKFKRTIKFLETSNFKSVMYLIW